MKKLFYLSVAISLFVGVSSCNKLELSPEDYYTSSSFWKTSAQVDGAMIGLHNQLRGFQFTLFTLGELRAGVFKDATGATGTSSLNSASIIRQDLRESSPGITSWAGFYGPIFQVNNFIYQVEQASYLSDADKKYYLGQAYGLRAFYYFHLFRTFGRLPITAEPKVLINTPTSSDQAFLARSTTEKETLDFIKADIEKSVLQFNNVNTVKFQKAQWSLAATNMLKAEIYLWSAKVKLDGAAPANATADLAAARTAVEAALTQCSAVASFANIFSYANKGNSEVIFAIRYQVGEATNTYNQFVYAQTDPMSSFVNVGGLPLTSSEAGASAGDPLKVAGGGTIIRYEYKYELFLKYDTAKDSRARATFFDFYKAPIASNKFVNLRKFLGTMDGTTRSFADDVPVYRWAEAMLILAEIKNKQGQDPSAEINAVRKRAYGTNPFPAFVSGSFEQNELAIFDERTKELVAEGKRWYDLRRMQDATGDPLAFRKDLPLIGVLDKATQAYRLIWPIDKSTLNTDPKLEQNPLYPGT
ncbi:MAG: hypothetical protein RLZZ45_1301 [Bacteroidota bacterium]|jgi:hypothetical protein